MTHSVDILLATFNGEAYLEEQLQSLFNQSYRDFKILIRDDGSTDKTLSIIEKFSKEHPHTITLFEKGETTSHVGSKANFSLLLEQATAPYIFFCDQDDVWLSNKIAVSLEKMKELETTFGKTTPLLVHSDLEVVDASLNRIHPSFWEFSFLKPQQGASLPHLLIRNVVTGCATLINQPLKKVALPISSKAIQHDWWVAIIANLFGQIGYVSSPTILYRQHTKNALGAKKFSWSRLWKKGKDILRTQGFHCFLQRKPLNALENQKKLQGEALLLNYSERLSKKQKKEIKSFIRMQKNPLLSTLASIKTRYF